MNSVSPPNCFLITAVGTSEFIARNHFFDLLNLGMRWKCRWTSIADAGPNSATQYCFPVPLVGVGLGLPDPEGGLSAVWTQKDLPSSPSPKNVQMTTSSGEEQETEWAKAVLIPEGDFSSLPSASSSSLLFSDTAGWHFQSYVKSYTKAASIQPAQYPLNLNSSPSPSNIEIPEPPLALSATWLETWPWLFMSPLWASVSLCV